MENEESFSKCILFTGQVANLEVFNKRSYKDETTETKMKIIFFDVSQRIKYINNAMEN